LRSGIGDRAEPAHEQSLFDLNAKYSDVVPEDDVLNYLLLCARHRERDNGREGSDVKRIVVGITGATGAIFGVRLIEALRAAEVETHLVLSKWGQQTVEHETGLTLAELRDRASVVHGGANMAATISSGSFRT